MATSPGATETALVQGNRDIDTHTVLPPYRERRHIGRATGSPLAVQTGGASDRRRPLATSRANLIVASNRLPVVLRRNDGGSWHSLPSSGGLVTALSPILRETGGRWIGWPGTTEDIDFDEALESARRQSGCEFSPVPLSSDEVSEYYHGFCNQVIWPLFHELSEYSNLDRAHWDTYCAVNMKFAREIAGQSGPEDYLWVQDYHLILVGRYLRHLGVRNRVGFFLHTPFPSPSTLTRLPWCFQIVTSLLEYDLIGFQTLRDKDNFVRCAQLFGGAVSLGKSGGHSILIHPERKVRAGVFPISIDFQDFSEGAAAYDVAQRAAELRRANSGCPIMLGVDRLDYSKGIPFRLKGYMKALEDYPELRGKVTLVQVVVPSRQEIPEYQHLKSTIEGLVKRINDRFARPGWTPVQYTYSSLERTELLAHYRAADIALVTPIRDGMNLVAKEYCAASIENDGVLILTRSAGAAVQLGKNALLVDPDDTTELAQAIRKACGMTDRRRSARMRELRRSVLRRDIYWWADRFLQADHMDIGRPSERVPGPVERAGVK